MLSCLPLAVRGMRGLWLVVLRLHTYPAHHKLLPISITGTSQIAPTLDRCRTLSPAPTLTFAARHPSQVPYHFEYDLGKGRATQTVKK